MNKGYKPRRCWMGSTWSLVGWRQQTRTAAQQGTRAKGKRYYPVGPWHGAEGAYNLQPLNDDRTVAL